ncbi:Uncharacterized protein BM_BM17949 [Brugia malayi]|uniref:Uncharacterized protein n=1 Tax=Brugia malayi TaxID=6279 RepID=A0A4E9ET62_BRUMA|nr:Uncharacterized protein BM_BM17949 [Brugia malayi]VIO87412.1 Uncharacterized protein BM_BM17949 [Brugia malayi]
MYICTCAIAKFIFLNTSSAINNAPFRSASASDPAL